MRECVTGEEEEKYIEIIPVCVFVFVCGHSPIGSFSRW